MKSPTIILLILLSSITVAQNDFMVVEMSNGTISSFPVSTIKEIVFSGVPTNAQEHELLSQVLTTFALYQNFPNPFNPSTNIQFNIPNSGQVDVKIFDIQGRLVRALLSDYQQEGMHSLIWDSRNSAGEEVSSGTYFCEVIYNGSILVTKLLLIK